MLSSTLEMIGAPNGIKTEEGIAKAAKRLTDEFGNFTLEDWKLCLYEMEAGRAMKHYNNTNLEWLIGCFQAYDERKMAELRQVHSEQAQAYQRETATYFAVPLQDAVGDRERAPRSLAAFVNGETRMKFDERDAMARRDVARREAKTKAKMRALVRAQVRAERKQDNPKANCGE